jgi:acyl-CoA reductase-like NAD-dependent aldehyde dehydrogenase
MSKSMYIDGAWVKADATLEVRNPFDRTVLAEIPKAGPSHVERALASAEAGSRIMAAMPAHARATALYRAASIIRERRDEMARTITLEAGKPIREARIEVARAAETLTLSAEESKRLYGETLPLDADPSGERKLGFTLRVPLGVVLAITPFNFPLNLVCHKVGPALAGGNAVVLKPAEETPLSALHLVEILLEAGFPPLALQCLTGLGHEIGPLLVRDPRVRKISFTGSRAVGEQICRTAGLKKVTMELGSNSPLIVFPDAELDKVAAVAVANGFANAGQVCISAQRVLVSRDIAEDFVDRLRDRIRQMTVGNPLGEDVVMGPMIRDSDAERVNDWIREAVEGGARLLEGGSFEGSFHQPSLITDVRPDMRLAREELFGPALAVSEFDGVEQAIQLANATDYGLSAGVFTNNVEWALAAAKGIESGNVMINAGPQWRADLMPYGGLKGSGLGKEGPRYAIQDMTDSKTVVFHL